MARNQTKENIDEGKHVGKTEMTISAAAAAA